MAAAVKLAKTLSLSHQDSQSRDAHEDEEEGEGAEMQEDVVATMGPLRYALHGLKSVITSSSTSRGGGGSSSSSSSSSGMMLTGVEGRRKRRSMMASSLGSRHYHTRKPGQ